MIFIFSKFSFSFNFSNCSSVHFQFFATACSCPNFLLPADANSLDKTKYNLCKAILTYKQNNDLTAEELSEKINLSFPETKEILLCHIHKFTLDRLITYLSELFPQLELNAEKRIFKQIKKTTLIVSQFHRDFTFHKQAKLLLELDID
jgi:predicted XRE-type DNA-binding protein